MLEKQKNTLASSVDDATLRALRQALRRKYAARSNLPRIFSQWCKDQERGLSVEELFMGLNKIGITTSLDQAKALHLNAKSDSDPYLTIEEFGKFLFTADEGITVDL